MERDLAAKLELSRIPVPDTMIPAKSSENPLLSTLVHGVVDAHREIGRLIGVRDTNGVIESMRLHLAGLSNRVHRDLVKSQLTKEKVRR